MLDMEFPESARSLLAEDLCPIVEGFVECFKMGCGSIFSHGFPQNMTLLKTLFIELMHYIVDFGSWNMYTEFHVWTF